MSPERPTRPAVEAPPVKDPRATDPRAYWAEYYRRHADQIKAKSRAWREEHRARVRAYQKAYHQQHAEQIKARSRAWYAANTARVRARRQAQVRATERRVAFWIPLSAYRKAQRLAVAKRTTVRRLAEELLSCYIAEHFRAPE